MWLLLLFHNKVSSPVKFSFITLVAFELCEYKKDAGGIIVRVRKLFSSHSHCRHNRKKSISTKLLTIFALKLSTKEYFSSISFYKSVTKYSQFLNHWQL